MTVNALSRRKKVLASSLKLTARLVTDSDLDQLREYRIECGWGTDRLNRFWMHPDHPLCIYTLEQESDGVREDVGMGGWILEIEGDRKAASRDREYGSVQLCKSSLSSHAFDLTCERKRNQVEYSYSITFHT